VSFSRSFFSAVGLDPERPRRRETFSPVRPPVQDPGGLWRQPRRAQRERRVPRYPARRPRVEGAGPGLGELGAQRGGRGSVLAVAAVAGNAVRPRRRHRGEGEVEPGEGEGACYCCRGCGGGGGRGGASSSVGAGGGVAAVCGDASHRSSSSGGSGGGVRDGRGGGGPHERAQVGDRQRPRRPSSPLLLPGLSPPPRAAASFPAAVAVSTADAAAAATDGEQPPGLGTGDQPRTADQLRRPWEGRGVGPQGVGLLGGEVGSWESVSDFLFFCEVGFVFASLLFSSLSLVSHLLPPPKAKKIPTHRPRRA